MSPLPKDSKSAKALDEIAGVLEDDEDGIEAGVCEMLSDKTQKKTKS